MLKLNIDVDSIAQQIKEFKTEVEQDLRKGVAKLAAKTWAKILEDSQQELHSSRKKYADALSEVQEITPGVYIIALDQSAMWIEEGIRPDHDMKPDLLKNSKVSDSGKRYKIIPFEHSKPPSDLSTKASALSNQLRSNMRREGIPWKKIEKDQNGSPRIGKLHQLDLGGPIPGRGNTRAFERTSIYQSMQGGNVRRDIKTFRTVTDGPESAGKFIHPGFAPKQFMDKAMVWASAEWEQTMLPEILKRWSK